MFEKDEKFQQWKKDHPILNDHQLAFFTVGISGLWYLYSYKIAITTVLIYLLLLVLIKDIKEIWTKKD